MTDQRAEIAYGIEPGLAVDEMIELLMRSGLAARRPADDRERIGRMLANADLVVTARVGALLVGVARSLSDFAYACYLSDLAVDAELQGRGVGRALIRHTRGAAGEECNLVLLAAPGADGFYDRAGLASFDNAWGAPREH